MARIRSVKPEYWSDDAIVACSLPARLLFIGMWNFADDCGNLDRSATQIKARVFPVDRINCEPLVNELMAHGLLIEYSVSGRKYLHIPGFAEHQVINRPSKPTCPDYDDSLNTHGVSSEASVSTHAGVEGSGREGSGRDRRKRGETELPEDFDLNEIRKAYVIEHLPDADPEGFFEQFTNKARAKGWTYTDWHGAFLTQVRNAMADSGHFAAGEYPKYPKAKRGSAPPNISNPDGTLNVEAIRGQLR